MSSRVALSLLCAATGWLGCTGWNLEGQGGSPMSHASPAAGGRAPFTTVGGGDSGGDGGFGMGGIGGAGGAGGEPFPSADCRAPIGPVPMLSVELVADDLELPVGVEVAPDDDERLFVLEKNGRIRVIERGVLLPTPFLDLTSLTWAPNEAGLLGLAFHPLYAQNGRFFVYYMQDVPDGAHIQEFRRSLVSPNLADPTPVGEPVMKLRAGTVHVGGALEFSPVDGYLYFANGDRGQTLDAQSLDSHLGKILRIDVATSPYSIPEGNIVGGLPELWDHGLRNPWRIQFDLCSGDLYIADVGEVDREEINVEAAGSGQHNYGWPIMEGDICGPAGSPCDPAGLSGPLATFTHDEPDFFNAIIGGVVYRGSAIPGLRGMYVFGATNGRVYGLRHDGAAVTESRTFSELVGAVTLPVAFGQDHSGEIYVANYLPEGRIFKLIAP